eukprot:9143676-Pyramimonas_sp.AAC.1
MASALRRILFVRHGECEMNLTVTDKVRLSESVGGRSNPSPLTQKGVEQAVFLGKWLEKTNTFNG